MLKRILPLLAAALIVASCSKNSNSGFVLWSTNLYQAQDGDSIVATIPAGSSIEYIDERPYDKSSGQLFKVRFDSLEGYFEMLRGCFSCTAAAVKTSTILGDESARFTAYRGALVAIDSAANDSSFVYLYGRHVGGWMLTKDISTDAADVAVAIASRRMESNTDEGRFVAFASAVKQYPSHPFYETIKYNLSEAQEQDLADIQDQYGLVFNQAEGKMITTIDVTSTWIQDYLRDLLFRDESAGDDYTQEGYEDENGQWQYIKPRMRYYDRYMVALPAFVNLSKGTFGLAPGEEKAGPVKSFLLYRLDRSPENISRLWSDYKGAILEVLEHEMVYDIRPDVKGLVEAYDRIVAIPNHQALVKEISKNVAAWDKENDSGRSGYTQIDQADIYEPIMKGSDVDTNNDGQGIWYHSFWVRRFSEGNQKVVYDILKELTDINPENFGEADGGYGNDGEDYGPDGEEYAPDDAEFNPEDERGDAETGIDSFTCKFEEYSMGDCGHLLFNCGDYGDADISGLTPQEQALWNDLIVSDSEGDRGNPEYVGKEFIITVTTTTGPACNEGQGGEGQVPKILEFRLNE